MVFDRFVKPNPAKFDSESQFAIVFFIYSGELQGEEAGSQEMNPVDFHREDSFEVFHSAE